jgi:hypothetical protein
MRGRIASNTAVAKMDNVRTIVPDFNVIVYGQIPVNGAW